MRLNSTLALSLIFLTLMFAAGLVSAAGGFALGREALKGVTQPEVRPTDRLVGRQPSRGGREPLELLREEDILANVKSRMQQMGGQTSSDAKKAKEADLSTEDKTNSKKDPNDPLIASPSPKAAAAFPYVSQAQEVTLEVREARQQGNAMVLDVSLRNDSSSSVRFLYSFLDITDDKGRPLSATTDGLPGELPSRSETFNGTIQIPMSLLEDAKEVSLMLTDYPDQKLQLRVDGVPISQ